MPISPWNTPSGTFFLVQTACLAYGPLTVNISICPTRQSGQFPTAFRKTPAAAPRTGGEERGPLLFHKRQTDQTLRGFDQQVICSCGQGQHIQAFDGFIGTDQ